MVGQRRELLELQARASNELTKELSRFPERPRGQQQPSRADALNLADATIAERKAGGAPAHAAMQAAAAVLRQLAGEHSYDYPDPDKPGRLKTQGGAWFASDVGDDPAKVEAIISQVADAAGLGKRGAGKRADHQALGEMVRALLDMQRMGVSLPAPTIRPQHMECVAFVEVLRKQGFLRRAGIEDEDIIEGKVATSALRDLSEAARHRLQGALSLVPPAPCLPK